MREFVENAFMGATLNVVVAAAATIFFVYFHLKWKIGSGKGEKRINIAFFRF
jgi:hypothetical protein